MGGMDFERTSLAVHLKEGYPITERAYEIESYVQEVSEEYELEVGRHYVPCYWYPASDRHNPGLACHRPMFMAFNKQIYDMMDFEMFSDIVRHEVAHIEGSLLYGGACTDKTPEHDSLCELLSASTWDTSGWWKEWKEHNL